MGVNNGREFSRPAENFSTDATKPTKDGRYPSATREADSCQIVLPGRNTYSVLSQQKGGGKKFCVCVSEHPVFDSER